MINVEPTSWASLEGDHKFKKARAIQFGEEPEILAPTWKAVARNLLLRAAAVGELPPMPFYIGRSKTPFLATSSEGMREGFALNDSIFFESHFSANDMVRNAIAACKAGGCQDWSLVKVDYREEIA
jgi:hypothetical protein